MQQYQDDSQKELSKLRSLLLEGEERLSMIADLKDSQGGAGLERIRVFHLSPGSQSSCEHSVVFDWQFQARFFLKDNRIISLKEGSQVSFSWMCQPLTDALTTATTWLAKSNSISPFTLIGVLKKALDQEFLDTNAIQDGFQYLIDYTDRQLDLCRDVMFQCKQPSK